MCYIDPLHIHLKISTSKGFVDHHRFMEQIKKFEIYKLWICYIKIYTDTLIVKLEKKMLNTVLCIVDTNDKPQYLLHLNILLFL